jgi:hypothetical protein
MTSQDHVESVTEGGVVAGTPGANAITPPSSNGGAGDPLAPPPEGEAAEAPGLAAPTLLRGHRRSSRGAVPGGPRRLDPGPSERPGRPRLVGARCL